MQNEDPVQFVRAKVFINFELLVNAKCRDFINCIYYYFNMCHVYIYIYWVAVLCTVEFNSRTERHTVQRFAYF